MTQFTEPSGNRTSQPSYSEKVAAMRPRKGHREPSFTTVRLETGQPSGSSSHDGDWSGRSSGYPSSISTTTYPPASSSVSEVSYSTDSSRRPSDKRRLDIAIAPSIRTTDSDVEGVSPTNESTASLIHQGCNRREADGGVRLAGGPMRRDTWLDGGGTLPPAYGEF